MYFSAYAGLEANESIFIQCHLSILNYGNVQRVQFVSMLCQGLQTEYHSGTRGILFTCSLNVMLPSLEQRQKTLWEMPGNNTDRWLVPLSKSSSATPHRVRIEQTFGFPQCRKCQEVNLSVMGCLFILFPSLAPNAWHQEIPWSRSQGWSGALFGEARGGGGWMVTRGPLVNTP